MRKKALIAMAALAVMCCSATAFAAAQQATCQDWKGNWTFTYDNATLTTVCVDNTTLTFCDNATGGPTCKCITDNNSKPLFCFNITDQTTCDNGTAGCQCVDNPLYNHNKGKKAVTIDNTTTSGIFAGKNVPCYATGKQGTTPITIVQVDNATAGTLGIDNSTYIVFEGTFDNVTFAQILPAKFTKDNTSTQFTAESELNFLSLKSGIKSDNVTPPPTCEQKLKIIPGTIFKLLAFVNPVSPYVIIADKSIEFSRPISIDWGTDAINDVIHLKLGKRLIFGFGFARPFKLVKDDFIVTVTYGDDDAETCGTLSVK